MNINNQEIMQVLIKSIKTVYSYFKGLYLYGSRAKQIESSISDFDIILLIDNKLSQDIKTEIYKIISKIEYEFNIFIDIQFLTEIEIAKNHFFYKEVFQYGQFYAA